MARGALAVHGHEHGQVPLHLDTGSRRARGGRAERHENEAGEAADACAGAVLWELVGEADPEFNEEVGEKWLTLLPAKFNRQVWYGWRYDPRSLASPAPAEQPEAALSPGAPGEAVRGC